MVCLGAVQEGVGNFAIHPEVRVEGENPHDFGTRACGGRVEVGVLLAVVETGNIEVDGLYGHQEETVDGQSWSAL